VAGKEAGGEPVTVRLARLGAARVRFVDRAGKPLANYRPVVWLGPVPRGTKNPVDFTALNEAGRGAVDALWLNRLYTGRYYTAGPRTDAQGWVTLTNLIPGATYFLVVGDRRARDFAVAPGQTLTLPDLVIDRPEPTKAPAGK
jgi:hypothetical protein